MHTHDKFACSYYELLHMKGNFFRSQNGFNYQCQDVDGKSNLTIKKP